MSHDNARMAADRHEARTSDHYPSCPGCGNLCGVMAVVCADCGTRLRLSENELRSITHRERIRRVSAAPTREDLPPATGTEL